MEFRIKIPDTRSDHVIEALAVRWGYGQVEWTEGARPQAKYVWVRDKIREYIRDEVRAYEQSMAQEQARRNLPDPF